MHLRIGSTNHKFTTVYVTTSEGTGTIKVPNEDRYQYDAADLDANDTYFLEALKDECLDACGEWEV
jgi:hypothetical protein